ncbi:DUF6233 domain-containing protein [Streptomyces sp. NPDC002012]|uniref:DUF6233 domain-containing protein n=1 Tax=Streptomyces sp. NPDC002012 TaxID=3154532 RepID=UPI003331083E
MTRRDGFTPVPVRVILPEGQELVARLYSRAQTKTGWEYDVGLRNPETGGVESAEYRVWVEAPAHVRPVDGVDYSTVPTSRLPPPSVIAEVLGPCRRSGWVVQKLGTGRGSGRGVVHAVDCEEALAGAPVLTLERALDAAQHPGTRLCAPCGAAAELDPVLKGFDQGFGGED